MTPGELDNQSTNIACVLCHQERQCEMVRLSSRCPRLERFLDQRRTYIDTTVLATLERLETERVQLTRDGEGYSPWKWERAVLVTNVSC